MLSPYRVLDLSDENGLLCGQMLADLGADVIQIEPPGGSSARRLRPFVKDEPGTERSLFWWAYARNKRGLVLDLERDADRDELRRLVAESDFLIESAAPGQMARWGLAYEDLAELNPSLVYVSITSFGQTGPKANWSATDLTIAAASGVAYLSGEGDCPPVRVQVPQAHAHAGADAAVGALIAHAHRQRTGRGQHVDVSAQQSLTLATMFRILDAPLEEASARRISGGAYVAGVFIPTRYPLRDGWVVLGPGFLPSTGHFGKRLLAWAVEEGHAHPRLAEEDWGSFGRRLLKGELDRDAYDETERALSGFFATKNKDEVMKAALERRLLLAPLLDLDEIVDGEQLASRDFMVNHPRPEAGSVRFPGPFARFGESPIAYRRGPPRLDEHGEELRSEPARVRAVYPSVPRNATESDAPPLEGVRILDLFWVLAGPGATRMLADYGATVIHVESRKHIDTLRVIPPYRFNNAHAEGSGAFQSANANKLGVSLDLENPDARDVVLDLARWADVVTESFAPGVIDHYGLGWKALHSVNPELIMISSCLMGQTGPWRDFTGFGSLAATVTGFQQLGSWPGRNPSGPYGAYTDFIAVRYNAACILAALEHRNRTGCGQYIDQSQAEAALHFIAPSFLDYTVNGRVPAAVGNRDLDMFPHGVFPTRGEDCWVAIAVRDDRDWLALCDVLERSDLVGRRDEETVVDEAIGAWTREREAGEVEAALQVRGVPAHVVQNTPDLFADPQLQHREHFIEIGHEIYQTTTVESSRLRLSGVASRRPESSLCFGRDNEHVLREILGYTPERIAQLEDGQVLV